MIVVLIEVNISYISYIIHIIDDPLIWEKKKTEKDDKKMDFLWHIKEGEE